jgi:cytochrome c peroxidase
VNHVYTLTETDDEGGFTDARHKNARRPVPYPTENPFSEEKRVLGKVLFWDEQLSSDRTVACGTCHVSGSAGTDPRVGTGRRRSAVRTRGSGDETSFGDSELPVVGEGFFYLKSLVDSRGAERGLGATSDGQARQVTLPCAGLSGD